MGSTSTGELTDIPCAWDVRCVRCVRYTFRTLAPRYLPDEVQDTPETTEAFGAMRCRAGVSLHVPCAGDSTQ